MENNHNSFTAALSHLKEVLVVEKNIVYGKSTYHEKSDQIEIGRK